MCARVHMYACVSAKMCMNIPEWGGDVFSCSFTHTPSLTIPQALSLPLQQCLLISVSLYTSPLPFQG